MNEKGNEVRLFMPRFGCINERRHQLHEVIRLSGMNLIVNDQDQPLIIKDDTKITLKVSGREDSHLLSMDSRLASLKNDTEIIIQKAPYTINLVELHDNSFLQTLRKKLLWGEDKRN